MDNWFVFLLICISGLLLSARIIGFERLTTLRHYAAVFLALMTTTYVIRPFLAFHFGPGLTTFEGFLPGISALLVQDLVPLAGLFAASVISFALGYRIPKRPLLRGDGPAIKSSAEADRFYTRAALALAAIGYLSFLVARRGFFDPSEGSSIFIHTAAGTGYANTTGYLELAPNLVAAGALLYYAATGRLGRSLLLAAPWLANQIYHGWGRMTFMAFGLGLLGVWLARSRQKKISRQAIATIAIALALALLLLSMRNNRFFLRQGVSPALLIQTTLTQPIDQALADFSGFEGTWFTYETMAGRAPRYGAGLVYQYLVKPIPRLLWPDKPYPGTFNWSYFGSLFGYLPSDPRSDLLLGADDSRFFTGPVKGAIGDALFEWGWAGLFVNFFLTGLFLAWIEERTALYDHSAAWVATYATTYGMLAMLARNSLSANQSSVFLLAFYFPLTLVHWIGKRAFQRQQQILAQSSPYPVQPEVKT